MLAIPFQIETDPPKAMVSIVQTCKSLLKDRVVASIAIACTFPATWSEDEKILAKKEIQAPANVQLQQELGTTILISFDFPDAFFHVNYATSMIALEIKSVYVYGRYNKFLRGIAQTYHYCPQCRGKGCSNCHFQGKISLESVEELLAQIMVPLFGAHQLILHGSGREDADVLCLGSGRPFIAELTYPQKRQADFAQLESQINSTFKDKIAVHDLRIAEKKEIPNLKHASHDKRYEAVVEFSVELEKPVFESKLSAYLHQELTVDQFTPTRVEKRRALMNRYHRVTIESAIWQDSHHAKIVLHTSAGCYIKEFISGDAGRSKPSLSSLLEVACLCIQLDVLEIIEN